MSHHESHHDSHHSAGEHPVCKVCSSPHSGAHRISHLGVCHSCWYKIGIVILIIMIAVSYIAWFGVL